MKTSFIPGPYKLKEYGGKYFITAGRGKSEIQIADVTHIELDDGRTDHEKTKANGQLLARAPRLHGENHELRELAKELATRNAKLEMTVADLKADRESQTNRGR